MKKIYIITLLLMVVSGGFAQKKITHFAFSDAEQLIDSSIRVAYNEKTILPLLKIEKKYSNINTSKSLVWDYYKKYWLAMIKYRKSEYLFHVEHKYMDSRFEIDLAAHLLQSIVEKNEEVYALLVIIKTFQYKMIDSKYYREQKAEILNYIDKAIEIGPQNPRVHYAKAFFINFIYKGKTTEPVNKMLKKATSLMKDDKLNRKGKSVYRPKWGDIVIQEEMIKYFLYKEKDNKAQILFLSLKRKHPQAFITKKFMSTLDEEEYQKIFAKYSNL